jgi:hypothetical protein
MTAVADTPHGTVQPVDGCWIEQAVRSLGLTTDVETAGAIFGIGRTKAYELAKAGEFPAKILRVGRRYVVPVPAMLKLLNGEQ